jgi:beta-sarcoglycan
MLLFFLAFGNLLLTFIILGVLRLGQGMESLELVPEKSLVLFYGNTDLDRIYKRDGKLEGFYECPVEITGDNGSVSVNLVDKEGRMAEPKINVNLNSTTITGVNSFDVHDPLTGHSVFSTDFPNFGLPRGVKKLDIKMAQTQRITSPVNSSLFLRSDTYTRLRGTEGTRMEGREIVWSADQDIYLKSVNGSVILSGREGISVDIKSIPVALGDSLGVNPTSVQYKVCVCMPEGKLFRVPVSSGGNNKHVGCHNVNLSPQTNPCM